MGPERGIVIALLAASALAAPVPASAAGDRERPAFDLEAPGRLAVVYWLYFDGVGALSAPGRGVRQPAAPPDRPPPGRVVVLSTPDTLCPTCAYRARGERDAEDTADTAAGHSGQALWLPSVPRAPGLPGFFPDWWPLPLCYGDPLEPLNSALPPLADGSVPVFLTESSYPLRIDLTESEP